MAKRAPTEFALATCVADVRRNVAAGLISLPMGMENGGPMASGDDAPVHFFERGIRYVTLAHAKSNAFSDSSYDNDERWQGLSEAGRALVVRLNDLGIMVDVSHISERAFWQVMRRVEGAGDRFAFLGAVLHARIRTQHERRHDQSVGVARRRNAGELRQFVRYRCGACVGGDVRRRGQGVSGGATRRAVLRGEPRVRKGVRDGSSVSVCERRRRGRPHRPHRQTRGRQATWGSVRISTA